MTQRHPKSDLLKILRGSFLMTFGSLLALFWIYFAALLDLPRFLCVSVLVDWLNVPKPGFSGNLFQQGQSIGLRNGTITISKVIS
jgi:hypothetical protein